MFSKRLLIIISSGVHFLSLAAGQSQLGDGGADPSFKAVGNDQEGPLRSVGSISFDSVSSELASAPADGQVEDVDLAESGQPPIESQDVRPPRIQIPESAYKTIHENYESQLAAARQKQYPNGYPEAVDTENLENVPSEPNSEPAFSTLIIRPEAWEKFYNETTRFGYGDTNLVEYMWWSCRNIVDWGESLNQLIARVNIYLAPRDKVLTARLQQSFLNFLIGLRAVSNRRYLLDPEAADSSPGVCDPPDGVLSAPTAGELKNRKMRRELKRQFPMQLLSYEKLTDREIIVTDQRVLEIFNTLDRTHGRMLNWLRWDLTPLMENINRRFFPDQNLLSNERARPVGVYDRKKLGYKSYYNEKYGKIYRYLPDDFEYMNIWESKDMSRLPGLPELLLQATHSTAVGLVRGALAFATEVMLDFDAKVYALGQYAGLPDPDFGLPREPLTNFMLFPEELEGAAERVDKLFMASEVENDTFGTQYWDDKAEMAKNEWRDSALAKLPQAEVGSVAAAVNSNSGQSTGTTTQSTTGGVIGNSGTQYRKTKGG